MATPLNLSPTSSEQPSQNPPRTVTAAKIVKLALVTYTDEYGVEVTQPAMVGDNTVVLLDATTFGFGRVRTPQGPASEWVRTGVLKVLNQPTMD